MNKQINDVVQTFKEELELWHDNKKCGKMCFTTTVWNGKFVHHEIKGIKKILVEKNNQKHKTK